MRIQAQRAYQGQEHEIYYLMYVKQFISVEHFLAPIIDW